MHFAPTEFCKQQVHAFQMSHIFRYLIGVFAIEIFELIVCTVFQQQSNQVLVVVIACSHQCRPIVPSGICLRVYVNLKNTLCMLLISKTDYSLDQWGQLLTSAIQKVLRNVEIDFSVFACAYEQSSATIAVQIVNRTVTIFDKSLFCVFCQKFSTK
jgi:hypothetical protein